jgi:hypothetical protein
MLDTKKKYGKTPEEIMALVDPKVSRATMWTDTQLSAERSRIQRYYDGELPKRQSEGSSSYVSSDVYDGVESMKSQLLEVFAGGHDIVRFKPVNEQDVDVARIETAYIADQVFNVNNGFDRFSDIIDDSLKNRNGVVQCYWEHSVKRDEHSFEGMALDDVQALASQEDVEIDADIDDDSDPASSDLLRHLDTRHRQLRAPHRERPSRGVFLRRLQEAPSRRCARPQGPEDQSRA